jgi:hypothetical protein
MRRKCVLIGSIAGVCVVCLLAVASESLTLAQQRDEATEAYIIGMLRQDSRIKLKQIMLALYNYQTGHKHFPEGTRPNPTLKPDKRLGWTTAILPFMEQKPLYDRIALDKSWDDKASHAAITTTLEAFLNPGLEKPKAGDLPPTHYVGLAGLGVDGPMLPVESPRAGCFAYDRPTRLEDIKDGTSNTAMICEASKEYGSWAAGGHATLRAVTKEPVIDGPDGIGGPWKEALLVAFADGSVRPVSKKVDAKIFRGFVTINGHEDIHIR